MQQALAYIETVMDDYPSPAEQEKQIDTLYRSMPAGMRPGAIGSETYDSMLDYLRELGNRVRESHETALMTLQTSLSSSNEEEEPQNRKSLRQHISKMLKIGQVKFKYMQLFKVPPCVRDLPGFNNHMRYAATCSSNYPVVLRVLVKAEVPRYAEIVSPFLLELLGWWFCQDTQTWCRNCMETNKFYGTLIYQMDMTEHITKLWEFTDAKENRGFQDFLRSPGAVEVLEEIGETRVRV